MHFHEIVDRIRTGTRELSAHILLVFIIPIVLLNTGYIPIQYRVILLVVLVSTLFILLIKEKWTFVMLGFQKNTSRPEILAYIFFTLAGILIISQLGEKIGREEIAQWWHYPHFLYMFFVVSVFQEIAYRGYLMPALGKIFTAPDRIVLTNALLFTFLHTIFPPYIINLPLAFIGGIGFGLLYMKYPNLWLMIISHAILNFVAVLFGFFMIPGVTY